jgi:hydrogenase maturation protein HypF
MLAPSIVAECSAADHVPAKREDWPQRVAAWISAGAIVAIKGLGGYHLACDATDAVVVARLRRRKRRDRKPFALMARDLTAIERYCFLSVEERKLLAAAAAPIVLLVRRDGSLPAELAPGLDLLGFMLPYTPLHHLLMRALDRPIVLTSGNVSDEPQCIDDEAAHRQLADIADAWVTHGREIVHRLDDSVARVMNGVPRLLRRGRGHAPAPFVLPAGFEDAPPVFAAGGMLKNTFGLLQEGQAVLSQHHGDLDHPAAFADYRRNIALYRTLFDHAPGIVAVDRHPEYLSTKVATEWAERDGLALVAVQHHHAHVASCLAENGVQRTARPVLGIALDGLGMGEEGALWGGELLLADYRTYRRIGCLKPVALLGGERAVREPWRNTYAYLAAALGWKQCCARYPALEIVRFLAAQPTAAFDAMLANGFQAPRASSCGRLFDAVAAAIGLCCVRAAYEGEPAMALEAAARACPPSAAQPYPFAASEADGLIQIDSAPMWCALLDDLARSTVPAVLAARFHAGLAQAICTVAAECARRHAIDSVALTGGVFQNQVLLEALSWQLQARGLNVLTHARVPAGDGGLALGQALVAAAQAME